MPDIPRRLTVGEAAERIRRPRAAVLALIRTKQLRAINVGLGSVRPRWVIDEADLEGWEVARANRPAAVVTTRRRVRMNGVPNYLG
jgi:hypothetical protein